MSETYLEMKERHQKEVNEFPIAFAFDNKQLSEAMKKLNATPDECVTIHGIGDIIKKTDVPKYYEMSERHHKELAEAMKDKDFAEKAFRYEMNNHEYAINWDGDADILDCFGYESIQDVKEHGLMDAYLNAKRTHMKHFEELGII